MLFGCWGKVAAAVQKVADIYLVKIPMANSKRLAGDQLKKNIFLVKIFKYLD